MCVSTVILLINNIDAISSFVLPTNISLLIATDPFAKTIIFCEDIDHAERMRKAIVNAAMELKIPLKVEIGVGDHWYDAH